MRVVSGKYKGRKLKEFDLSSTKPTLDKVKEAIFDMIQFDVVDSVVLDLFSGTGALGIEAISRGAKKTFLVDNNLQAIKIIKENLKGITEDYSLLNQNGLEFLKSTNEKFDIVLLDPPYNTDLGVQAIEILIKQNKLHDNAIILFETSNNLDFNLDYENFKITKKKYGSVAVYKMVKQDEI